MLDLSSNNFVSFPSQLQFFLSVEELDISGNHLSQQLPSYLKDWTNLHTLNLSNNNFDTWSNYGLSSSLRKLDLSKNKIYRVAEDAFSGMLSLRYISLSENRLNELPTNVLVEANNLENLILSRNYFSTVPDFQSSSLRSLDLSSCQIAGLSSDSLAGMPSLLEIDLSINQIESIPDYFASNTLQELDLSYNGITALTVRTFSSLPHLAVLDLRGNEFKEVWSTAIFASNPFLREIHLKGNRWNCEGFSVDLLLTYEFLTREPPKVSDRASLICYYPSNVTQLSWQEAYIQTWHPSTTYETFTVAAVMIGVIIGILITSAVCRGLMSINNSGTPATPTETRNYDGDIQTRVDSVVLRIPLREDLPPSYDEALLMPTLNSSFHSLPDFVDEEQDARRFRRSRSIGDLVESRPRAGDRRSVRPHRTVEINIE